MAGKSESAVRELHRVYLKLEQLDLLAADIVMPDPKLPDIDKPRLLTERPALCALASDLGEMCATKNVTRIMRGIETGTEKIPQLWESLLTVQVKVKTLPQKLSRKPLRRHDVACLLLSLQDAFVVVEGWYDILKSRLSPDEQERIEKIPADLRKWIEDLPPDDTPDLREAYRRDHLWLKWHSELRGAVRYINATIRDQWNKIPDAHRKIIAPRCSHDIGNDRSGAETVRTGLTKARNDLKKRKARSVRKGSSKSRSSKET